MSQSPNPLTLSSFVKSILRDMPDHCFLSSLESLHFTQRHIKVKKNFWCAIFCIVKKYFNIQNTEYFTSLLREIWVHRLGKVSPTQLVDFVCKKAKKSVITFFRYLHDYEVTIPRIKNPFEDRDSKISNMLRESGMSEDELMRLAHIKERNRKASLRFQVRRKTNRAKSGKKSARPESVKKDSVKPEPSGSAYAAPSLHETSSESSHKEDDEEIESIDSVEEESVYSSSSEEDHSSEDDELMSRNWFMNESSNDGPRAIYSSNFLNRPSLTIEVPDSTGDRLTVSALDIQAGIVMPNRNAPDFPPGYQDPFGF